MIGLVSLLPSLFKLGDKLIEDKDKKAEFANNIATKLLDTSTYKWVDALVKLAYASEAIIKGLFRPIGAACMMAFAIYAELTSIELSESIQVMLYGSPLAWGYSRHKEKQKSSYEDEDWQI